MFFLELSCFFHDPVDVGNLISGSSAFSNTTPVKSISLKFLMFKLDLEKTEEPEIKLPTPVGSLEKQESSRKPSTSDLLTMPKLLTVWNNTNWKILEEMGTSDHLTCLLRNLCAGQEATVRTRCGTMDWFQIGKGICQGCILSLCLFNLYAEYIMQNARLDHAQAGEISITSDMQMIPPLWQKSKEN